MVLTILTYYGWGALITAVALAIYYATPKGDVEIRTAIREAYEKQNFDAEDRELLTKISIDLWKALCVGGIALIWPYALARVVWKSLKSLKRND